MNVDGITASAQLSIPLVEAPQPYDEVVTRYAKRGFFGLKKNLSGIGSDGARGAALVKEANDKVLVQAPASAKFDGMPRSVIESNNFDGIATPAKLPSLIGRIISGKTLMEKSMKI